MISSLLGSLIMAIGFTLFIMTSDAEKPGLVMFGVGSGLLFTGSELFAANPFNDYVFFAIVSLSSIAFLWFLWPLFLKHDSKTEDDPE